ncbi:hypothetical protein [Leifsonia aquatica]|uniref:hypothetical protein n=1 Tax=Leifsonia aquatica TaxID=144185 RepID=UPI0038278AB5
MKLPPVLVVGLAVVILAAHVALWITGRPMLSILCLFVTAIAYLLGRFAPRSPRYRRGRTNP